VISEGGKKKQTKACGQEGEMLVLSKREVKDAALTGERRETPRVSLTKKVRLRLIVKGER